MLALLYIGIYSVVICSLSPFPGFAHYCKINFPIVGCASSFPVIYFIGLAPCVLRNGEVVNCSFCPTALLTTTRVTHGSSPVTAVPLEVRRGCEFPSSFAAWVFRYIEVWQLTLPHTVELLAIHGPVRDPCLPDLSQSHDLDSGVFGGADSTAPSSCRARRRYPASQQDVKSILWD